MRSCTLLAVHEIAPPFSIDVRLVKIQFLNVDEIVGVRCFVEVNAHPSYGETSQLIFEENES